MISEKISIITVSFNAESTIEQTIKSVISQGYSNVEYIIIDGASTDSTVEIIRKYEDKITYWLSEPDSGIYDAMNKGLSCCTGDVVAFLNSDDYYLEGALEYVANYFDKEKEMDILCCEVLIDEEGKLSSHQNPWERKPEKLREGFMMYSHQGMFVRRHCFEKYGDFNLNYKITADYDWLLRVYNQNVRIIYSPEVVTIFRFGGLSTTNLFCTDDEVREVALKAARDLYEKQRISVQEYEKLCHKIDCTVKKLYIYAYSHPGMGGKIQRRKNIEDIWFWDERKYSIFGAGGMGGYCLKIMKELGLCIECFVDNDSSKWGKKMEGIIIKSPEEVAKMDTLIIVASQFYEEEILAQLHKMKLVEGKNYISCTKLCDQIELVEMIEK